ncbi:DUF6456 domain-containing protein [Ancylobacter terrae]|uniref:DUF6456 domain-containing protein n=1 Tax=Ancylobacter sp. sgz301288 TaxID=3342077 RepID=UPI00385D82B8
MNEPTASSPSVIGQARIEIDGIAAEVLVDLAESPLAWLARRKGRDGRPMVDATQLVAGERLRLDFTRAQMTPRLTSDWSGTGGRGRRRAGATPGPSVSEAILAAKERVDRALTAVGPEFAGLLLDVCCFLKGMEQVESERGWPARAAKVVLGLGLDRLARHYGVAGSIRGRERTRSRAWLAPGARPTIEDEGVSPPQP